MTMVLLILLTVCILSCKLGVQSASGYYCQPRPTDIPCSKNYDCECYSLATGGQLCANSLLSCNDLTPCNADGMTCSQPNTICVTNSRCQQRVCYPIWLADSKTLCPSIDRITTTESPFPAQCWNYTTNMDGTRNVQSTSTPKCDPNEFANSPQWVRFSGAAGTIIATSVVPPNRCGAYYSGYYTGTMPTRSGETVSGKVCYNWMANTCYMSNTISVTNCNGYFVYALTKAPNCSGRYCTA